MTQNLQTVTPPPPSLCLLPQITRFRRHSYTNSLQALTIRLQNRKQRPPQSETAIEPLPLNKALFSTVQSQPHLSLPDFLMLDESMTFKSMSTSGTASSKASSLFDLDEHGSKPILVYKYRSGAKGLETRTEHDLCAELDQGKSS